MTARSTVEQAERATDTFDIFSQHPPIPLEEALHEVDGWKDGWGPFRLHQIARSLRDAYRDLGEAFLALSERHGSETERLTDRIWSACQAIPCSAGLDDCHAPYYRHHPCCNLRVALWPGEEFPTDYLPEEGVIHLFEPVDPAYPRAPRKSAGCVRLIQPRTVEERYCGLPAFHTGP